MANKWIIDVLADLATFAEQNGLSELERQLILASEVAETDLGTAHGVSLTNAGRDTGNVGLLHRATSGGHNA